MSEQPQAMTEAQMLEKQMPTAAEFRTAARCMRFVVRAIATRPWWEQWFLFDADNYTRTANAFEQTADIMAGKAEGVT